MDITDELIAKTVDRFAPHGGRGTVTNILAFSRVLKELGVKIGLSQVIDSNRSLHYVNVGSRGDFRAALRSNLLSDKEQIPIFDRAFDLFCRPRAAPPRAGGRRGCRGGQKSKNKESMGGGVRGPRDGPRGRDGADRAAD